MNEISKIFLIEIASIIKPLAYFVLIGEVGIRLYLQTFDKVFWIFLITAYVLLYLQTRIQYKQLFSNKNVGEDK